MSFKITFKGLDRKIKGLLSIPDEIDDEFAKTLFQEMEDVAGRSKETFVPVDTGALRGSIHATPPKVRRGSVSTSVVAGGPAAPYALTVHENLQARHPLGQAKYLERPLNEARPTIERELEGALGRAIKKGLR